MFLMFSFTTPNSVWLAAPPSIFERWSLNLCILNMSHSVNCLTSKHFHVLNTSAMSKESWQVTFPAGIPIVHCNGPNKNHPDDSHCLWKTFPHSSLNPLVNSELIIHCWLCLFLLSCLSALAPKCVVMTPPHEQIKTHYATKQTIK